MLCTRIFVFQLFLFITLVGCAKTDEQLKESAIREARYHLTSLDCGKAIDILDDAGEDLGDADYVAVYASAIACQAGYTDLGMAINNLTEIDPAASEFLSSFAGFDSSNETTVNATSYTKILEAITYILNANGGTSPSTVARLVKYGSNDGNDLSMQAVFMSTVALGKYLAYYGNTDEDGLKGAGTNVGGGNCLGFYDYDVAVDAALGATPLGSCASASDGHAELDPGSIAPALVKSRMCEGIILFNNLFEILSNIDVSGNTSLGNIDDAKDVIDGLYTAASAIELGSGFGSNTTSIDTMKAITSQAICEVQIDEDIQEFFLFIFETSL